MRERETGRQRDRETGRQRDRDRDRENIADKGVGSVFALLRVEVHDSQNVVRNTETPPREVTAPTDMLSPRSV